LVIARAEYGSGYFLKPQITLSGSATSEYLLSAEPVSLPILYGLVGCLHWPDSISLRRALKICIAVVPKLTQSANPKFYPLLHGMFTASIEVFTKQNADIHWELAVLMRDIFISPVTSNFVRDILLSLPKVTPSSLESLEQSLVQHSDEKKQRDIFKHFLQQTITEKTGSGILDLDEKVVRIQKIRTLTWQDDVGELGISLLVDHEK